MKTQKKKIDPKSITYNIFIKYFCALDIFLIKIKSNL